MLIIYPRTALCFIPYPCPLREMIQDAWPFTLQSLCWVTTPVPFCLSAGHLYTYIVVWEEPASRTIPYCHRAKRESAFIFSYKLQFCFLYKSHIVARNTKRCICPASPCILYFLELDGYQSDMPELKKWTMMKARQMYRMHLVLMWACRLNSCTPLGCFIRKCKYP